MSRHARIAATLQGIVGRVLRIEPRDLDVEVPFLELGADSLALVEALRGLQETFGVKLTIRQLFEQLPTISALAAFLDQTLPAETPGSAGVPPASVPAEREGGAPKAPHPPAPSPIAPPSAGRGGEQPARPIAPPPVQPVFPASGGSGLDRVMAMQIQAFNQLVAQQLAMLGGRSGAAPVPPIQPETPVQTPVQAPPPPASAPAAAPVLPAFVGKAGGRPGAELTERQRRHLDGLIERYCRKTAKSKELTQRFRPWLADSRAAVGFRMQTKEMLYPLARARSQGSRLWDVDGNEYVDVTMGMGVHLFGHDPEFLRGTIEEQVREGFELGPRSAHSGEVAALFCELTGMERATFTNSGTEACMTAIRLARARTGRSRIVMFAGSYHGHADGTLAQTQEVDGELRSFPVSPGVPPKVAEDVLVLDYGTPEALEIIRRHRGELAAVIVEPIQSRRPELQPREFLRELRRLTAESGIALIFDEMVCGFRLHLGGAQAWFGVRADLATYGKVVGGGLPIGVVAGAADFMDGIDGGMWRYGDDSRPERDTTFFGGTFCQHPLAMAAARRVLGYLKEQGPGLQETLNARTARFAARLNGWLAGEGVPISVKSAHSLFRFAMTGNTELLYYHLVEKGVYVWEWRNCFLSTAHTDADLDFVAGAVQESVEELRRGGFLPEKPGGGGGGGHILGFWDRQGKPAIAPVGVGGKDKDSRDIKDSKDARDGVGFSLYFFGNYAAEFQAAKYDLLLDCARFADRQGFSGLWFPERHFHPFGGISPNPSVLAAALARETERIALRAGSVVLPLHHPVRVAEEWALVDNLSGGRVGLSYASGWHPNDFALAPEAYGRHRELMIERMGVVEKLWRGEAVRTKDGAGTEVDLRIYPLPARRDLPVWITIVNNPETYRLAGEMGAGVLTNLMGQTAEGLAANLAVYREALARAGHPPAAGHVTLLLHTFVGPDAEAAIAIARRPFYSYLESSVGLLRNMLASEGMQVDWDRLSRDDLDYMLELAYQRYVKTSALIGSPETCAPIVERLRETGVDEIACLIDFGVEAEAVRESLPWLTALKDRFRPRRPAPVTLGVEAIEVPLTEAQRDLWTVAQLGEEASLAYLEAAVLEMRGPLDLPLLRRALQAEVDRHEALRTVFDPAGTIQRVLPALDLNTPLVDATGCPKERHEEVAREWLACESRRPMDLVRGPLLRFTVLRLDARRHRLAACVHHIVADGLSVVLFLKEALAVYEAGRAGRRAVLPEPYPFREYVAWLERGGAEAAADEPYWLERMAGEIPVFEPPVDHPRPAVRNFRGDRRIRVMDPAVYRALHQAGRRQGATLFISLLAAWTAVLHRWTGQDDLAVGGPTARRPLEGGERLVGHCVDLVPYRSRLENGGEGLSFQGYLAAVRTTVFDAHDHGGYPLARLLAALRLPHDPSRAPLLNAIFNLDPGPGIAKAAGLELAELSRVITHVKFDVALHVLEAGGDLHLFLDYRTDLFDAATMERQLGHLVTLAAGAAADPSQPLADLPLLSEMERRQLAEEWNRTGTDYPRDTPVDRLFAAVADRGPEAPAVIWAGEDGEEALTYAELRERAERLARELRALGVGPEDRVALEIERSPELVVAMLGVLMAGGAYVPLDPSDPEERRAFLLADSGARVRIGRDLTPDPSPIAPPPPGEGRPLPAALGDALAYVIYTSGSTGRPKGVAVPHRAVARLVLNTDYIRLGPGDRIAHVSNTAFDAATFEVWGALLTGAALVVIPREVVLAPAQFGEELKRRRITSMFLTTALLNEVAREAPAALGAVRDLFVGGEAVSPGRMREVLAAAAPGTRLANIYGPTESTTFAVCHPIASVPEGRSVPIGRPIANTRAWVLDRGLRPVPLGSPGELCLGGDGLARGYLGRPELTAERFAPNPFEDGGRLYRTGDLARFRPDGAIEFLGRTDGQVKIRGFRVEIGEIEAVLGRCPGVREAVVVVRREEEGRSLLGCLLLEEGAEAVDARAFLRTRLPEAMIPSAFVVLDAFPRTPSGKVDRRALAGRPLDLDRAEPARQTSREPRTPVEEIVAAAWADVLRLDGIGVDDDFFGLGGHSLLAGRVLSRLRGALGVELSLRDFFRAPTVAGLAELTLTALAAAGVAPPLLPVPRRGEPLPPLPLSLAQERLWLVEKLEPGTALHAIPVVHWLSGPLRPAVLAAALSALVERQESLRTVLVEAGGEALQRVVEGRRTALPLVDLGGLPAAMRRSAAERLAAVESLRPFGLFDLTAAPPLRAFLIRLAEDDHALFLNVHHIAADEWSLEVMARELSELYAAGAEGRPAALPALPVQYADFAVWQRGWLRGAALAERLAWWREHLAGSPAVLELPADRSSAAVDPLQAFRGGVERMAFPAGLAAEARRLGREQGATFFLTLFAVFQVLLHRLTGQTDLLVGTPVAGRDRTELEGLVGFFINTLVLRTDLSGSPTFAQLLSRVREAALGAYPHQDLPFAKLVEALAPQRGGSRNPLVQVTFSVPDLASARLALPGLRAAVSAPPTGTSKFDLSLFVGEVDGELEGESEYATGLFEPATIRGLLDHYAMLLAACAAAPETPVESLAWLSGAARAQLLAWSRTPAVAGAPVTVHELVAAWAEREPERIAVTAGERRMSYGELAVRAADLSRRLAAAGLEPEARVGVFLERSPDLIVALLAVLQAGAAYLPLDPEEPAERLAMMLEDAGASLVLTERRLAERLPASALMLLDEGGIGTNSEAPPSLPRALPWAKPLRPVGPENAAGVSRGAVGPKARASLAQGNALGSEGGATSDSLAYVTFTSGSTGRPKGVAVPHGAVVRLVFAPGFARMEGEVFLQIAPVAFDASTFEIWGALANGGELVLPPGRLAPREMAAAVSRHGVTTIFLTTALFLQMMEEDGLESSLRSLRQLLTGGDVVPAAAARRCLERLPGLRLIHCYGPTENTTFTTTWTLTDPAAVRPPLSLGRPIAASEIHVVDRDLRLVPFGVPGELVAGGRGLARGYQGRPDLTAERFVPHPFPENPGERLYRTGDLARFRPDGTLEFLGRRDAQVKVRGIRVELAEVEGALAAHPGVREAAVVVRRRGAGDESLVAFFVPRSSPPAAAETGSVGPARSFGRQKSAQPVASPGRRTPSPPAAAELREALSAVLPAAMIPSAFLEVDALPLTSSGKVDRRELARRAHAPIDSQIDAPRSGGPVAPRTALEEIVAGAWAEVLGLARIGVHDDFFLLGGHSLLAARILSRVRYHLGIDLSLRAFFGAPTVAGLAARIEESLQAELPEAVPPLVPLPQTFQDGPLPLTFAQERLWFLEKLLPGTPLYALPLVHRIAGPLRAGALAAAFAALVRRHESLRTVFAEIDGAPVQRVLSWEDAASALPLVDLTALPDAQQEAERLLETEARRSFDLTAGPLVRALLVRTAAEEHALLIDSHHIVSDGWSADVMARDLSALYEGRPLPELPVQVPDVAIWQRSWLTGEALERRLAWWRVRLAGCPTSLELPADRPPLPVRSGRGGFVRLAFSDVAEDIAADVRRLAQARGATPFLAFLAAFQVVLQRWTGQPDLLVGTPVAGRGRDELQGLIGFFVNTLPLRAEPPGERTFAELLAGVRESALAAFEHQDLPFEKLVEALVPERDPSRHPLVQVMFSAPDLGAARLDLGPGVETAVAGVWTGTAKVDLSLSVEEGEDGLAAEAEFDADRFDAATIERLLERYRTFLAACAAAPDAPVDDLPWLSEAEEQQLATGWNQTFDAASFEVANTQAWVVDAALRPVPVGTPGELCLGGDGLARGYLGRPDLTAERFVPNPFAAGERLYRTGDRVRRRADGAVEFLGRTDGQVKVRGFRIEPEEIEKAGKPFAAPRTPSEEILAGLWAEVLQVGRVGLHDDFFGLGGHSLLAARLLARVRQALGVELALQDVFQTPTVAGLARRAEEVRLAAEGCAVPPLRRVPRDGSVPLRLSFAQERLWLIDQLQPGSAAYNSFLPARLTGRLHEPALEAALAAIVRRHEVLRTHFGAGPDGPVQVIAPVSGWRLPVIDLGGLPEEARTAELHRLVAAEARWPFDLARGPLFRATLVRLMSETAEDQALLLGLHHSVCDGWSLEEVMTGELSALYRAAVAGAPSPLPPLPVQYADFAQWQREWLQGPVLEAETAWWKEHLGGEPPALDLPTDHPRPAVLKGLAATAGIVLPPAVLAPLLGLGRGRGVTLFMILLAALQTLLHRWSGQDRVSVGTPVANRGRMELEGLIGFFINTLVLCIDLAGDPSAGALLERVRDLTLGAFDHQDLPFEKLVAAVQTHRDPSRNPLFQVLFVLQNNRSTALDLPGLTLSVLGQEGEAVSQFDLSFSVVEAGGALHVGLAYSTELFERATAVQLLGHLQQVAVSFGEDPERRLSEIPLLGIPERRQVEASAADAPAAAGPAPEVVRAEIRQRRDQLASRRRQLSPERQALLRKWVGGAPERKAPERSQISPLVPIQPAPEGGGGRPALFLVHPGNGNVNCYLELAKHLGPEQPLYGLQSPGLSGGEVLEGMDAIASCYLAAVREAQPRGPYRLGGWCLGGTFAFEMARRLRREGEEVDLLLFIDSHGPLAPTSPASPLPEPADEAVLLASLAADFAGAVGQRFEVPLDDLRRIPAEERLDWVLEVARRGGILPESFAPEQARNHWEVFRANVRATERYVPAAPEELPLRTVLFRAGVQPPQAADRPALGWDAWIAGPLEVVPLEGDHYELVRSPRVRGLAGEIAARLVGRLAPEEVGERI